jgi:hypothetical protein
MGANRRIGLRGVEPRLRAAALFPPAACLVHQLRYWLTAGGGAGRELQAQGHAYLGRLSVPLTLLAASAAGAFVTHLMVARRAGVEPGEEGTRRAWWLRWLAVAAALLAVYTAQELLEGALATGHPAGLAGVFGGGGWLAAPAALAVGALLSLLLRAAETILRLAGAAPRRAHRSPPLAARRPRAVDLARLPALARRAAGRAPPRQAPAVSRP